MCNLPVNVSKPWNTVVTLGNYIVKVSLNWPEYVSLAHLTDLLYIVFYLHVTHVTRYSQSCLFSIKWPIQDEQLECTCVTFNFAQIM